LSNEFSTMPSERTAVVPTAVLTLRSKVSARNPLGRSTMHNKHIRSRRTWFRFGLPAAVAAGLVTATLVALAPTAEAAVTFPVASLDGSGNNVANPNWGRSRTNYLRVGPVRYANGIGTPNTGPNSRLISNRVFSDNNQNVFSDHRVTQWGWTWGQFLDHTFGLAAG